MSDQDVPLPGNSQSVDEAKDSRISVAESIGFSVEDELQITRYRSNRDVLFPQTQAEVEREFDYLKGFPCPSPAPTAPDTTTTEIGKRYASARQQKVPHPLPVFSGLGERHYGIGTNSRFPPPAPTAPETTTTEIAKRRTFAQSGFRSGALHYGGSHRAREPKAPSREEAYRMEQQLKQRVQAEVEQKLAEEERQRQQKLQSAEMSERERRMKQQKEKERRNATQYQEEARDHPSRRSTDGGEHVRQSRSNPERDTQPVRAQAYNATAASPGGPSNVTGDGGRPGPALDAPSEVIAGGNRPGPVCGVPAVPLSPPKPGPTQHTHSPAAEVRSKDEPSTIQDPASVNPVQNPLTSPMGQIATTVETKSLGGKGRSSSHHQEGTGKERKLGKRKEKGERHGESTERGREGRKEKEKGDHHGESTEWGREHRKGKERGERHGESTERRTKHEKGKEGSEKKTISGMDSSDDLEILPIDDHATVVEKSKGKEPTVDLDKSNKKGNREHENIENMNWVYVADSTGGGHLHEAVTVAVTNEDDIHTVKRADKSRGRGRSKEAKHARGAREVDSKGVKLTPRGESVLRCFSIACCFGNTREYQEQDHQKPRSRHRVSSAPPQPTSSVPPRVSSNSKRSRRAE